MGKRFQDHLKNHASKSGAPKNRGCTSGKVKYRDKGSAMDAALGASLSYGLPMRTYDCDKCGGWHLTRITREWLAEEEFREKRRIEEVEETRRRRAERGSTLVNREEEGIEGSASSPVPPTES